jgi:RNA polymerase sigma-70 factor (ECF subfamily)
VDDGRLVQRHLEGDPLAFGALVDRYQARVLTFISRTVVDRGRAEELAEEVFIRAFRHLRRFDRTTKFSTWIYAIASTVATTELRGRARHPPVSARPVAFEDATAAPGEASRSTHLAAVAARCVRGLPEPLRDAFVLRELEGMSSADIAEITGCDVGTVRNRLTRARILFAQAIEPAAP